MIIAEILYGCQCDRCGVLYEDYNSIALQSDRYEAFARASEDGWNDVGEKHYCPECHAIDEEGDSIIVKEPYPDIVSDIERYIKFIKKRTVSIEEKDHSFRLTFGIDGWEKTDTDWVLSMCKNKAVIEAFTSGIKLFPNRILIEIQK